MTEFEAACTPSSSGNHVNARRRCRRVIFAYYVTLSRTRPCIDLAFFMPLKEPDPWPEAGWLCLPFAIDQPQFRLGRLGSIIDPAKDCVRGANNEMFSRGYAA